MARTNVFSWITRWFSSATMPDSPHAGDVLTRHAEELMRLRGVMSVGLGRDDDGRPAIVLGLENPLAVPENLPESVEGIPVVHRDVGRPEAPDHG
jgi:microsomal dipeptidase-like Zn-dependent dipeptidase